jgi:hypothetical protein
MSDVIRFLETVGSKPLSAANYIASVNALDAELAEKQALLRHDKDSLECLLARGKKMYCAVFAADED